MQLSSSNMRYSVFLSLAASFLAVTTLFSVASAQSIAVVGVTTGVNPTTGERPSRRNINDVYNEAGAQWDLLVQALDLFQRDDMNDVESYYQIAGIHGLPYVAWDGVGQVSGGAATGYCPHGQATFATWHRPYLALFEQILASYARKAAEQYPAGTIDAYRAAAQTFRFPFWDWASNASLPDAASYPVASFNGPAGPDSMPNPLYSYQFPNYPFNDSDFDGTLAQFNATKRCTTTNGPLVGTSDTVEANNVLDNDGSMLTSKVYAVFTQSNTFESMATTANSGASFEDPHNYVHNDIGCLSESGRIGHMGYLSYSGFDPIFFLHHANVDRLIAMWQAIYSNDTVFTSSQEGSALFGTAAGPQTADSPLRPFWTSASSNSNDSTATFHTSRSVEAIRTFGYTYPELPDWSMSPNDLAASVRAAVNRLYGQGEDTVSSSTRRRGEQKENNSIVSSNDYSVELSVDRAQLPLPCTIDLLLVNDNDGSSNSSNSSDTSRVSNASIKLGGAVLLSMPSTGTSYTLVPLRRALLTEAPSYVNAGAVVTSLRQRLRIVIKLHDGTIIPADSVSSLHVEIQQRSFEPATSIDAFPQYGPIISWPLVLGLSV